MAKFYFDMEVLGLVQASADAEDFPDLATAIAAAKECTMQMVAEEVARGECPGHGSLLVRDEAGQIVYRVSFLEAEVLVRSSPERPPQLH
jgi:hypothetical protein